MKKPLKRLLIVLLCLALVGGAGAGGYYIWKSHHTDIIEVFPVSNVAESYWGDTTSLSGQISAGKVQDVMLREGLVEEIRVAEGDVVHKGDVLMVYDTTSLDLALQSDEARIAVMESNIDHKEQEILKYGKLLPSELAPKPTTETIDHGALSFVKKVEVGTTPHEEAGGVRMYRCQPGTVVTKEFLRALRSSGSAAEFQLYDGDTMYGSYFVDGKTLPEIEIIEPEPEPEPEPGKDDSSDESSDSSSEGSSDDSSKDDSSDDSSSGDSSSDDSSDDSSVDSSSDDSSDDSSSDSDPGEESSGTAAGSSNGTSSSSKKATTHDPIENDWVLTDGMTFTGDGVLLDFTELKTAYGQLTTCSPVTYERYETIYHDNFPSNPGENYMYSRKELAEMTAAAKKDLVNMQMDLRELNIQYEKDKLISETGEVTAELDGTITVLKDPSALQTGELIMTVKGNENYTLTAFVSESRLASIQPGDTFSVFAYESGSNFTATVSEIENMPVTGRYSWGDENPNNSYYPVIATVDDPDLYLSVGEYCEVQMDAGGEQAGGLFIPRYLVRKDEAGSYVMKTDENQLLKKQYVRTGRILWGEMYEITAGLTYEDTIAFPYGKTVREGAETTLVDYPELN